MKRIAILSTIISTIFFLSCTKTDKDPSPNPGPPPPNHFTLQFKPSGLANLAEAAADLEFIISIRNAADEPVLVNQKLALIDSGGWYSSRLSLPNGSYKLEKFLLARKTGLVRFATPLAGFAKAQQVNRPLAIDFSNAQQNISVVNVELLPVTAADRESMFGYPEGTFNQPTDPNDPPVQPRKIRIHPIVKIGDIVYDSIPAFIQLNSWDAQNQVSSLPMSTSGGLFELELPASAVRHQFRMVKWGQVAELLLDTADIEVGQIYQLQISANPRKLKQIFGSRWVNNAWVAETKTEFQYSANGQLQKVLHFRKTPDNTPFVAMTEEAEYNNGKISRVIRKNEKQEQIGNSSYQYNADGRLSLIRIQQGDSITHIQLQYLTYADRYDRVQIAQVGASYEYNFSALRYQFLGEFDKGRMLKSTYASNNGNLQESLYNYDQSINPFQFIGLPDEKRFVYSVYNRKQQTTVYVNEYAESEPYQFQYSYNEFGYPTELLTSHRNPVTGQHLFNYRESFVY